LQEKTLKQRQESTHRNAAILQQNTIEQTKPNASRFSHTKIMIQVSKVWLDPAIAESIVEEALKIIKTTHLENRISFSGKSKDWLLSGLFYLVGIKNEAGKTQREIIRKLNSKEVTKNFLSRLAQHSSRTLHGNKTDQRPSSAVISINHV
jgi:hypothetical protein